MTRIALVTSPFGRDLDDDMPLLVAAFAARGVAVDVLDWDDPAAAWDRYDQIILRSPWDYTMRLAEFLAWAQARPQLRNPYATVRWNADKRYLADVAAAGLPVVPTQMVAPGESLQSVPGSGDIVVKPSVGAGSRGCSRLAAGDLAGAQAAVAALHAQGLTALVQPYLDAVDRDGETALLLFGGEFSHAIRKGPLLQVGAAPQRALFADSHIQATTATAAQLALARDAMARLPQLANCLYVRLDLIADSAGQALIHEVEAIEPSLFLGFAPGAAERFVAAVLNV
jgi:glutathione synthase/RimK-type ligase-like ATP-grasp enzyme